MVESSARVMNFLVAVIIFLSTAQENHGLEHHQGILTATFNQTNNNNRARRYATHLNSVHRDFDFFNNEECMPMRGQRRFFCPTPNERNEWICITLDQLCNTKVDCPQQEDEDSLMCLFHRPVVSKLEDISKQLDELHNQLTRQINLPAYDFVARKDRLDRRLDDVKLVVNPHSMMMPPPEDFPRPNIVKTEDPFVAEPVLEKSGNNKVEDNQKGLKNIPDSIRSLLFLQSKNKVKFLSQIQQPRHRPHFDLGSQVEGHRQKGSEKRFLPETFHDHHHPWNDKGLMRL